jgi:hypothetical protein
MVPFKTTSLNVSAGAVVGTTLSAQGVIYASGGNSSQWNSSYNTSTTYQSTSSNFVYQRITSFTPTVGDWYRIITGSGMMGGTVKIGGIYNNCITDVEFQFNMAGYSTGGSIQQTRFSSYNNGNVSQVRIGSNPSAGNFVYLDINVGGSSGAYAPLYIQYTPSAGTYTGTLVTSPVSGATVPSTSAGYYYLLSLGHGFRTTNSVIGNSIQDLAGNTLNLKANINSPTFTGTVGGITKAMVGLGNVDNTSDANKPVSTAQQTALNLKANLASPTFTGTVGGITKAMVGLGNVDNTSDANKPVSTATQTLLQTTSALLTPLTVTRTLTGQLLLTSVYQGASGNWQSTYTTVQNNSASWEESADILPTVTNYLSTNNVLISGLNVTRDIVANRIQATVKNFYIKHPTKPDKHLVYSSLETPYNGIQLTGEDEIVNGLCVVELPGYLNNLIHSDSIHIQLTNYQHSKSLYVDRINIDQNNFTVKCDSWFSKSQKLKFFWLLNGVRKDIERLETEV